MSTCSGVMPYESQHYIACGGLQMNKLEAAILWEDGWRLYLTHIRNHERIAKWLAVLPPETAYLFVEYYRWSTEGAYP